MTRAFEVPEGLLKRAEELAEADGVSLDFWVTSAVAQKIGAVETAAEFFRQRAAQSERGLQYYLDRVPNAAPMAGDELPLDWPRP